MNTKDNIKPMEVFSGTSWDAGLVKSLLDDREIEAFIQDDEIGVLAPWYISPGGVGPIKVVVSSADYEAAKQVVDEYYRNINSKD
ncbi:MAG TPA: DUF2007-related protein [Bacteroidales bacterium]